MEVIFINPEVLDISAFSKKHTSCQWYKSLIPAVSIQQSTSFQAILLLHRILDTIPHNKAAPLHASDIFTTKITTIEGKTLWLICHLRIIILFLLLKMMHGSLQVTCLHISTFCLCCTHAASQSVSTTVEQDAHSWTHLPVWCASWHWWIDPVAFIHVLLLFCVCMTSSKLPAIVCYNAKQRLQT